MTVPGVGTGVGARVMLSPGPRRQHSRQDARRYPDSGGSSGFELANHGPTVPRRQHPPRPPREGRGRWIARPLDRGVRCSAMDAPVVAQDRGADQLADVCDTRWAATATATATRIP